MTSALDDTHDPELRSWVQDANGHSDFPIQNLPLGVFRPPNESAQSGIAIGNHILPLSTLAGITVLDRNASLACEAVASATLNQLLSLEARHRIALRKVASAFLAQEAKERVELLYPAAECELLLPVNVGDYTDFYAGIVHAENVGKLFRPQCPLLPNYKWIPIGYHGRSSSVRISGHPVRRPNGQRNLPGEASPTFGPTRSLDFELELGIWVGVGNEPEKRIAIEDAAESIAGYCLLNDWSARDIQSWEYQPLGPFLSKSFHTTISGWIITPEALAPFRQRQQPRNADDPQPLPYLFSEVDQATGALNIRLEVFLTTAMTRSNGLVPHRLTRSNAKHLFWTPAQLVTHHASNGCNLTAGDLLGTGTISAPAPDGFASLLEWTRQGTEPITLCSGEIRHFLEDGDEVILRARASRQGYVSIGFGECRARVTSAEP
jgi:fumarylacetoacetase